ncbi:MAG: MBL fold metallo-hydrolase [Desulfobacterales bacterium]|nr:MBL fold metallo-hydrolase [Desulfobacterales bacterium]
MIVKFWGVRGSVPTPLDSHEIKAKIEWALKRASEHDFGDQGAVERYVDGLPQHIKGTYGGNTSCVQLQSGGTTIIFDAGSGIRALGKHLMDGMFGEGAGTGHLFLSHTHWDHIQGFPFFLPAYVPGNRIVIYSPHPDIQERIKAQQVPPYFPVSLEAMEADIEFVSLSEGETITIDELSISNIGLKHPGESFGYRVEKQGASFVYATDTALNNISGADLEKFVSFFSHAKVAVFDAQYTTREAAGKEDWGHSSPLTDIDMALQAEVRILVLFHHEPTHDDHTLYEKFEKARKYLESKRQDQTCTVVMAYEGLQLVL